MIVRDRTKRPVDVAGLAQRVTRPRPPQMLPNIPRPILMSNQLRGMGACSCESGLGFYDMQSGQTGAKTGSVLGSIASGASFVPGVGSVASGVISIFSKALNAFEGWLGIGAGRKEADLIVPTQNDIEGRLGQITNAILLGRNVSVPELQSYYRELWQLGVGFMEFVSQAVFTDRRASGQALNTIMPYIDGTCGYPEPLGSRIPTSVQGNCLIWGSGTLGGPGNDGMMGAVGRAILASGGTIPEFPATSMIDAANSGFDVTSLPSGGGIFATMGSSSVLMALGIAVLFMYSRKVRL